jgi:hypothetical protein
MAGHVLCALPGRVPQSPHRGRQHRVTPDKGRDAGAAFFWFLFLAAQEKELAAGLPPALAWSHPHAAAANRVKLKH